MTVSNKILYAFFFLLPLCWYVSPLFKSEGYFLDDLMAQYYPWWEYARARLRQGEFPLWNPYVFSGMPYHINPENALFYPLKWPFMFLSFFKSAILLRIANTWVATFGMYFLLKFLKLNSRSSFLGAIAFAYGSFMAYEFVHIPYTSTAVWFPLQLLYLKKLMKAPHLKHALCLSIITALSFLGGSPGVFLICQITLLFFFLFDATSFIHLNQIRHLLQAFVFFLCLTSILWAPVLQFIPLSLRSNGATDWIHFSKYILSFEGMKSLLFPFFHYFQGAPYPPLYPISFIHLPFLGCVSVLLCLSHFLSKKHWNLVLPILCSMTFGILMARGTDTSFLPWMTTLFKPLGWFRWPHDHLLMIHLTLPILMATGHDVLLKSLNSSSKKPVLLWTIYFSIAFFVWPHSLSALLAAVTLFLLWKGRDFLTKRKNLLSHSLAIFLLLDLYYFQKDYSPSLPLSFISNTPLNKRLQKIKADDPISRFALCAHSRGSHLNESHETFPKSMLVSKNIPQDLLQKTNLDAWIHSLKNPSTKKYFQNHSKGFPKFNLWNFQFPLNWSMVSEIQEISGYDPFILRRVKEFYEAIPFPKILNLLNVRTLVSPHPLTLPGLIEISNQDGLRFYKNQSVFPRVTLPTSVIDNTPQPLILEKMTHPQFDPRHTLYIEESIPKLLPKNNQELPLGEIKILDYRPESISLEANLPQSGFMTLHDVHYPGWKVFVNNREQVIYRGNGLFRSVLLPKGQSQIKFQYRPYVFLISCFFSVFAWSAALGVLGFLLLKKKGNFNAS